MKISLTLKLRCDSRFLEQIADDGGPLDLLVPHGYLYEPPESTRVVVPDGLGIAECLQKRITRKHLLVQMLLSLVIVLSYQHHALLIGFCFACSRLAANEDRLTHLIPLQSSDHICDNTV